MNNVIDNLKTVRVWINEQSQYLNGSLSEEGKECVVLLTRAIDEYYALKEAMLKNASERSGWLYLIKELEDKITLTKSEVK